MLTELPSKDNIAMWHSSMEEILTIQQILTIWVDIELIKHLSPIFHN